MAPLGKMIKFLDPSSGIPTDVSFVFKEEKANNVEVKAHKVILAMASEVFRREFFGSLKEVKENVIIKNANHEVFHTMIEFIYSKHLNRKDYDLCFLSSLYDLAERYDIEELRKEIITNIPEYNVNEENVLEVAILAESNVVHNQLSEALYNLAVGILKKKFDDKLENALDFFSKTEATEEHGLVLLKIMAKMKNIPSSKCGNCKLASRPCLDGHDVTDINFVKGANVVPFHDVGNGKRVRNLVKLEENGLHFTGQIADGSLKLFTLGYYMYKCA